MAINHILLKLDYLSNIFVAESTGVSSLTLM